MSKFKFVKRYYFFKGITASFSKKTKRMINIITKISSLLLITISSLNFFTFFSIGGESSLPFPLPQINISDSGKATTSIAIPLPPSAGGEVPEISINYNSVLSNGIMGIGWELNGVEFIARDPSYGIQLNSSDHYISTTTGSLVINGNTSPYYHSKVETFNRFLPVYDSTCDNGPCSWVQIARDGSRFYYGEASGTLAYHSQIKAAGSNTVKIWALNKVRDRHGNGYDIVYLPRSQSSSYYPMPSQIVYNQGQTVVEFEYENRQDKTSNFLFGGAHLLDLRLRGIDIKFQNTSIDSWTFEYGYDLGNRSFLKTINRKNFDPLSLNYTSGDLSFNSGISSTSKHFGGADFNAFYKNSDNRTCENAFNSCAITAVFGNPFTAFFCLLAIAENSSNCNRGFEKNITYFVDVSGDSIPDFVRITPAGYTTAFSNVQAKALAKITVSISENDIATTKPGDGSFSTDSFIFTDVTKVLPLDINGDFRTDFIILEDYNATVKIALSQGTSFQMITTGITAKIPKNDESKRWLYLRPDQKIYHFTADMNGDGRGDFIQYENGNLNIYYSTGSGFGTPFSISAGEIGNYGSSSQTLVDLDGNDIPDLIRFSNIDNPSTRTLIYTLFDENRNIKLNSSKLVYSNGDNGNAFFSDINGDHFTDFIAVLPGGTLNVFLFDGKNFRDPYSIGMNGVHYMEGTEQYMDRRVSDPYLMDIRRDGGPLDKIVETNLSMGAEEITIFLHNNSDQFNEEIVVIANYPEGVYNIDSPSVYYDIDKDGTADTIFTRLKNGNEIELHIIYSSDDFHFVNKIDSGKLYASSANIDLPKYPEMTNSLYESWRLAKTFADMDGDGKHDFIWFDGTSIRISFANSDGNVIRFNSNGDSSIGASSFYSAIDLNRDGRADLIGIDSSKNQLNQNINHISVNSDTVTSMTGTLRFHVKKFNEPIGLLSQVSNGSGEKSTTIQYATSFDLPGAVTFTTGYPSKSFIYPDNLVKLVSSNYGGTETSKTSIDYSNHKFRLGNREERRDQGFEKITSTTTINGIQMASSERYAIQDGSFYTDGIIFRKTDYLKGLKISTSIVNYITTTSSYGTQYSQPVQERIETFHAGTKLLEKNTAFEYDTFGNTSKITQSIGNYNTVLSFQYLNDASSWILGLPYHESQLKNGVMIKDRYYTYSTFNISSIQDFPGKSEYTVQSFEYDSFGNPIVTKDTNNTPVHYQFDPILHKFPVKITNAMGHSILREYDYTNGREIKLVNENGGITLKEYDQYGRPTKITYPNESSWSEKYNYFNTGKSGEFIEKIVNDPANGNIVTREYLDVLGRLKRKETDLDESKKLVSLSEYNPDGSLKRRSNSYIEGFDSIYYTNFIYNESNGLLEKVIHPDGKVESLSDTGFYKTVVVKYGDVEIHRESIQINELNQTLSKEIQGQIAYQYEYDQTGRLVKIIDSANQETNFYYDLLGRKTKQEDKNSGTITYKYDSNGNLEKTTDARGVSISYTYDVLGRILTSTGSSGNFSAQYEYDSAPNGKGLLYKVVDNSGSSIIEYDINGNITKTIKKIDDLIFIQKANYDSLNRITELTYPDGTIVHNVFSKSGYLNGMTMDVPDRSSYGYPIVEYKGPILKDSKVQIIKKTGNGVETSIAIDPIRRRTTEYTTVLPDTTIQESTSYEYDLSGNITTITDRKNPSRTQTFKYDSQRRVIEATGKYGTEAYEYSQNGNLTKKGQFTYQYNNPNHTQAVSSIHSQSTGTLTYAYDAAGNMIQRNDDVITYNDIGKLQKYQSFEGGSITHDYDFNGERVRRTQEIDGSILYSLGGHYEVLRKPGVSDQHTLYIKGNSDEIIAQFSRSDATLLSIAGSESESILSQTSLLGTLYKASNLVCSLNGKVLRLSIFIVSYIRPITIVLFLLIAITLIKTQPNQVHAKWVSAAVPVLLLSFSTFSSCSGLIPGGESGDPPWLLFPSGVSDSTSSLNSTTTTGASGNGNPVDGMQFYHHDHLGSTTMLTDGYGKPLSGGDMPGVSQVSYKPYGEILRSDSKGPDVFRFKYSGQEEEAASGLINYKSRFYDPQLGRFLQPDSVASGNEAFGMNRYMYVNGNPPNYVDPSGKNAHIHMFNQIVRRLVGADNKDMIRHIKKDIIKAFTESDDPAVSLFAQTRVKAYNKQKLRAAQREQAIATGVAVVITIVSIVMTAGLSSPYYAAMQGTYATHALKIWATIGLTAGGYVIGSTYGYVMGGYLGAQESGGWDERNALQGAYVGGLVGAAIGAGIGMYQYEKFLVDKGNLLITEDATKALGETYLNQSKFLFGLKDGSRWLFSKDVSIGFIKASLFAFSHVKTVATSKNNPYAGTDLAINFFINLMTPIPNISYSTYHEINEKTNSFDYLTY